MGRGNFLLLQAKSFSEGNPVMGARTRSKGTSNRRKQRLRKEKRFVKEKSKQIELEIEGGRKALFPSGTYCSRAPIAAGTCHHSYSYISEVCRSVKGRCCYRGSKRTGGASGPNDRRGRTTLVRRKVSFKRGGSCKGNVRCRRVRDAFEMTKVKFCQQLEIFGGGGGGRNS
ncbi:hypothetical protein HNY73_011749 [Argiope bruennichi]|uniref:Uncharacterized protein n=1 Tax=Argiope bruennichi TaxID=94029 RepID=A0A8T0ESS4_ARGBR|nr:hypothetical protein HNY73_011749 [Argiope bruennichi]